MAFPRGVLHDELVVVSQNPTKPFPSDVLLYAGDDGDPLGALYASVFPFAGPGGSIARFNLGSGQFVNIVFDASGPQSPLNRPAGLTFGPDGRLYVVSNSRDADNPNQIVIFDVRDGHGTPVDTIVFDQVAGAGSELVFGPGGELFVTFNLSGALRRYDVSDKSFFTLVQPGSAALGHPGYLVFRGTDPATRAYRPAGGGDDDD